ncbi:MAG: RNA recognition motif domain-containing protein [bacterium]
MNLYVGNLSFEVTNEDLQEAFEKFGQVSSVNVIKDRYSGESRGFGFVEMPDKSEAVTAISELNGVELKGKNIAVSEARPRRDQRGGGGNRGKSGGGGGWHRR